MSTLTPRFAFRLLAPALALSALVLLGEPIQATTAGDSAVEQSADETARAFAIAIEQEAELLRKEAEAARRTARHTAAQMRWFITLPAASSKRCSSPGCAS